ncbi:E3 binding domain-containing protein [Mesorhizobium sp.]|uniref:E3 binding domain-containing protein n=1 Tax=Mesorhizobium sp. TaxID=1871066 RepID=UPI0025E5DD0A|nr:E3 binding domain-containing protein [Mesorhizobium sp.]
MNVAVAQRRRLAASPYARRLARERSLPLEALHGSGPGGRILAADVIGFVPAAGPVEQTVNSHRTVSAPRIAAFATSIALGALRDLQEALKSAGKTLDLDDMLLRAAGRAIAEAGRSSEGAIALELPGRQMVVAAVPEMPLASLRATRLAALTSDRDDAAAPALLSLRLLPMADIRPVTMPLLPGRAMRLTLSIGTHDDGCECLLTADAARIEETIAATFLAAVKAAVENPLRLLV